MSRYRSGLPEAGDTLRYRVSVIVEVEAEADADWNEAAARAEAARLLIRRVEGFDDEFPNGRPYVVIATEEI